MSITKTTHSYNDHPNIIKLSVKLYSHHHKEYHVRNEHNMNHIKYYFHQDDNNNQLRSSQNVLLSTQLF